MSAESSRHVWSSGPLIVPAQPPADRSIIDTVSGFINDVKLTSTPGLEPKDVIQWARFETVDVNEPQPEGDYESEVSPLILTLGYGSGAQIWFIPPNGDAQEVLSWRQSTVRVLRILPTPIGVDSFGHKRPLIALCDSVGPGPTFCSLSFISLKTADQVKSIKFKNPILDVLANKRSVVVSFAERFAVFDAGTLEDRMSITTCYPCPCLLGGSSPINPLALGDRWLAYADKKINPSKRSSGGCESEGVQSYTATVIHAAKSLSKGLRGLGESVASSLSGARPGVSQPPSPPTIDQQQAGVVTVIDIEGQTDEDIRDSNTAFDPIVAHFVAHSDAIVSMKFDASGMLLVTADKRGHDFHVFRIQPHPSSSSLAAVHHLYTLHRGDTTSKVQDISISLDSRWVCISTLRGTSHVFAISPYGGTCGVRTHTHPRVLNRHSRFHRSAGLSVERSNSPVSEISCGWFPNPRLPPYPSPVLTSPQAQLRSTPLPTHTITRTSSGRQRLSSMCEETGVGPVVVASMWGSHTHARPACAHALYVLAPPHTLTHYRLHPRPNSNVSAEKVSEDSPIEVEVEERCTWKLLRPHGAADLPPPLHDQSPLLPTRTMLMDESLSAEERWLSQVEMVTHAGPHRRLWMGPQFVFKTYNSTMGSAQSLVEEDVCSSRSPPVAVPARHHALLAHSGSASSLEYSPCDSYRRSFMETVTKPITEKGLFCDLQLKEDLAEAMKETEGRASRDTIRFGSSYIDETTFEMEHNNPYMHNIDESTFRAVQCAPLRPPPAAPKTASLSPSTLLPAQLSEQQNEPSLFHMDEEQSSEKHNTLPREVQSNTKTKIYMEEEIDSTKAQNNQQIDKLDCIKTSLPEKSKEFMEILDSENYNLITTEQSVDVSGIIIKDEYQKETLIKKTQAELPVYDRSYNENLANDMNVEIANEVKSEEEAKTKSRRNRKNKTKNHNEYKHKSKSTSAISESKFISTQNVNVDIQENVTTINDEEIHKSNLVAPWSEYEENKLANLTENEHETGKLVKGSFSDITKISTENVKLPKVKSWSSITSEVKVNEPEHNIKGPSSCRSWSSIASINRKMAVQEEISAYNSDDEIEMIADSIEPVTKCYGVLSLTEKLAEMYNRTDILIAECDAPKSLDFDDKDNGSFDYLQEEPLSGLLKGIEINIANENLVDIECTINDCSNQIINTIAFNENFFTPHVEYEPNLQDAFPTNHQEGDEMATKIYELEDQTTKTDRSDIKLTSIMEKSSDDDNISPVSSSQTDSEEKDERKIISTVSLAAPKPPINKKKSKRKKR